MAGLDPAIHASRLIDDGGAPVDPRVKPGGDGEEGSAGKDFLSAPSTPSPFPARRAGPLPSPARAGEGAERREAGEGPADGSAR